MTCRQPPLPLALLPDLYGPVSISHAFPSARLPSKRAHQTACRQPDTSDPMAATSHADGSQIGEVPKLAPQALKLHQLSLAALSHLQGFVHVQEEATTGSSHMVKTSTVLHNLYKGLEECADGHSDPDLRAI